MNSDNSESSVRVGPLRVTPGARHGLGESTATCDWVFNIETALSPEALQRIRDGIERLWPSEPWAGVPAADWPLAFVAKGAPPDDGVTWALALTVAIQRLARDPVGFGQVLEQQGSRAVLALPCQRENVLKGAMQFALQHILFWLQEGKATQGRADLLQQKFAAWLPLVQQGGASPNTMRFASAARTQGIPFTLRQGMLHLGCGGAMPSPWTAALRAGRATLPPVWPATGTRPARSCTRQAFRCRQPLWCATGPAPKNGRRSSGGQWSSSRQTRIRAWAWYRVSGMRPPCGMPSMPPPGSVRGR